MEKIMKDKFEKPCIIKDTTNTVLIMNDGFGYHLRGEFQGEVSDKEYYIDSECTNITHEYLQNTYGEVVSPEHAELINSLSLNCGGTTCGYGYGNNVFWFEGLDLYFGEEENSGVCIKDKKK